MHVVLSLGAGGTERLVIDMACRMSAKTRVLVCCIDDHGSWAAQAEAAGVEVAALHRRPGFRPALAERIASLARRHRTEVIHCHHYSPFVYGRLASLLYRRAKLIYTEHGLLGDTDGPSLKRRIANLVLARGEARIFAVSEHLRRHMIREGFPGHRVGVIRNGIERLRAATPKRRVTARRLLGVAEDALLAGTVARLDPVKDLETMLAGLGLARRAGLPWQLVVVGNGTECEHLAVVCHRYGLHRAVRFLGHRDDIDRLLPGLDCYLNTSIHEGISVTILEAMAVGLPVIATAVGGNPEVVLDGQTGYLIPARSAQPLCAALARITCDPTLRASLGAAGRVRQQAEFSFDRMLRAYLDAYRTGQCATPM